METIKPNSSQPCEIAASRFNQCSWEGLTHAFLRVWAAAAIALSATLTGAAPVPYGYWNFDNAANREQVSNGTGSLTKNGTVTYVQGPNGTSDGAAQLSGSTGWYTCTHGMLVNGGSTGYVRQYTLMWDMKYPTKSTWKCLLQTNSGNSNDGDLFIRNNTTGNIGASAQLGGYSSSGTSNNTWYRIVMTCDTTLGSGDVKVYVNGSLWYTSTSTTVTSDGTYALDPSFLISKDNDGEDTTMVLSSFAVWNSTLSAADVTSLGTVANVLAAKTSQTVSFDPISVKTFGDAPFTVGASASSGLPITFSVVSGPATVNGGTVTITGAGAVTLQASQAGDATYFAASANQSFTVNKASQTVTFDPVTDRTYGDEPFSISASASTAQPITFSVISGPATVNGNTVAITGAGTVTLQASQAGDANYSAASANQTFKIIKANQTVSFDSVADKTYGDAPFTVSASASSGLPVTFDVVSGPATVSSGMVTLTGTGAVTLQASQAGDANYNSASANRSFTVVAANSAPTLSVLADLTVTNSVSTGPISFTVGDAESAVSDLTVTGGSDNPVLVPDENIVFSGSGADRTVTVTPAAGQSGSARITLTVSDGTLTTEAGFMLTVVSDGGVATHTLVVVSPCGGATPPVGTNTLAHGVPVVCLVTNSPLVTGGAQFICTGWSLTGGAPSAGSVTNFTLVPTNDMQLVWGWSTNYWLDLKVSGGGTIGKTPGWIPADSNVVVDATGNSGWGFSGWIGDTEGCTVIGTCITVPMTRPRGTVTALFERNDLTLTVSPSPGTCDPAPGTYSYANGASVSCTASDQTLGTTQLVCTGWTLQGSAPHAGTGRSFSTKLMRTSSLAWQWQTNYWLSTAVSGSGSVSVSDSWQPAGVPVEVVATPGSGQRFDHWSGDTNGCAVGGNRLTTPMDRSRGPITADFVSDADFTVVTLPDTQNYSTSYPSTFSGQTAWIVNNIAALNIQFVSHEGDIVNTYNSSSEWANSVTAMNNLNGHVPYLMTVGNHDISGAQTDSNYLNNYGPNNARWKTGGSYYPWYGGASPSGLSSYAKLTIGGRPYIFLNLDIDCPTPELTWAQGVINSNRNVLTFLTVHNWLAETGGSGSTGTGDGTRGRCHVVYTSAPQGNSPDAVWQNFVKPNNEIFAIICGHNFAQYSLTENNNAGKPVHEIMADYQTLPSGGNGFLRIMKFRPSQGTIENTTYSTSLGRYMTQPANSTDSQGMLDLTDSSGGAFTLNVDLDHRFDGTLTVSSARGPTTPAAGSYSFGSAVPVLCAAPDAVSGQTRYRATGWTLSGGQSGSGAGNRKTVTMNGNATLTWQWATDYWLSTAEVGDGQVSVASGWQPSGAVVTLHALPDAGATFLGWSGDTAGCAGSGPSLTVTMDRARGPITAQFSAPSTIPVYTLTVTSSEPGANPTPGSYLYASGSVVNCSAALATLGGTQTVCTGWALSDGTSGGGSSVAVALSGDRTLAWSWKTRYALDTSAVGPGTVTALSGWLDAGSSVTLTAQPDEQAVFVRWEGDLDGLTPSGASLTFALDRARGPVTARFAFNSHTVSIISEHGSASPSGTVSVAHGSVVTNEVADEVVGGWRYVCTGWRLDGLDPASGNSNLVVYACTNDASLTWLWTTQVLVRIVEQGRGVVTPMDASGWRGYGTSLTLHAQPSHWYRFDRWAQDASGLTPGVALTLNGPRTVEALFAPETAPSSGAPVWWMERRGLTAGGRTPAEAERIDTDGDGVTDAQEYISGTSPDDPDSALAITDAKFGDGNTLTWRSVAGRTYDVLCSTNLADGFAAVLTDLKGQDGHMTVSLPDLGAARSRFWRVSVRMPDAVEQPPAPTNAVPSASASVPPGSFVMGDGDANLPVEKPAHTVTLAAFAIDRFEVTRGDWHAVAVWANSHGYDLPEDPRIGDQVRPDSHPVTPVSWYEAVKWCNARSEMEGCTPCYYTDGLGLAAYRTGRVDLVAANVNWSGDGYRLPTEAEWECAARGSLPGTLYPWGNESPDTRANEWHYWVNELDTDPGAFPWTTPVGYFNGGQTVAPGHPAPDMANGYGLYDMAGNVMEWCWDRRGAYQAQPDVDPRGPDSGDERAVRGGSWWNEGENARCAFRYFYLPDGDPVYGSIGFRCVRRTP